VSGIGNQDFTSLLRSWDIKTSQDTREGLEDTTKETTTEGEKTAEELALVDLLLLLMLEIALRDFAHHVLDCGLLVGAGGEELSSLCIAEFAFFVELAEGAGGGVEEGG